MYVYIQESWTCLLRHSSKFAYNLSLQLEEDFASLRYFVHSLPQLIFG